MKLIMDLLLYRILQIVCSTRKKSTKQFVTIWIQHSPSLLDINLFLFSITIPTPQPLFSNQLNPEYLMYILHIHFVFVRVALNQCGQCGHYKVNFKLVRSFSNRFSIYWTFLTLKFSIHSIIIFNFPLNLTTQSVTIEKIENPLLKFEFHSEISIKENNSVLQISQVHEEINPKQKSPVRPSYNTWEKDFAQLFFFRYFRTIFVYPFYAKI